MKRREINPPLIRSSKPTPYWRALVKVVLVLLLVLFAYMLIDTLTHFKPQAEAVLAEQEALQARLDAMAEELTKISQEVEAWPGITEIPDETIPPLADPADALGSDPELLRIVALEADASYDGALAVATVIFNRLEAGTWGSTLQDVLAAPGQFTTYKSTRTPPITDITRQACLDAAHGIRNLPGSVLYFCTPEAARRGFFTRLTKVGQFAGHVYFEEPEP